jgi:hypothetical protein
MDAAYGPVVVAFPGDRNGRVAMALSLRLARERGNRLLALSVAERLPRGVSTLHAGTLFASPWTPDRLLSDVLNEADHNCREAIAIVPQDVSIESRVAYGRADRVLAEALSDRPVAGLVIHHSWLGRRWMRRAFDDWRATELAVHIA